MSVWWRVYASAWARSPAIQEWAQRNLDSTVSHGSGASGAEDLADTLQDLFSTSKTGVLTTLDWPQAFDFTNPQVTVAALEAFGVAPQLLRVLRIAWLHQNRFVCYGDHVHPQKLHNRAMPQGCPLSPLMMAIWVSAGVRSVRNWWQLQVCLLDGWQKFLVPWRHHHGNAYQSLAWMEPGYGA